MKVATFGARLTQAMSWRGMNGDDLARASGVHKSLISRYKNNKKEPMDDRVDAMATALNVNPQWLRGYDVAPEPNIGSQLTVSPREKKLIEDFRFCDSKNQINIEVFVQEQKQDYVKRLATYKEVMKKNADSHLGRE